jgi:2-polyprenyl-3-methyl-5-hydroxy-6-metoxy-1,4-benzoquinol methylase
MAYSTDNDWERLGQTDPFWAVLSEEVYRRENLSDARLAAFLRTGEAYVADMWTTCIRVFGEGFGPKRALDFGCGVGRIALPLSRRVQSVVAVDVAASMLAIAGDLLKKHGADNVSLRRADATLSGVEGPFDLVHSFLVFQHVPAARGLKLIERLADLAAPSGAVVIHVLYDNPFAASAVSRGIRKLVRMVRPAAVPTISMNPYPLNAVFKALQTRGFRNAHVQFTDHESHLGVLVFSKRRAS